MAVWLGGSWLAVGALLRPVLPGGWETVTAVMAILSVPVFVLMRAFGGAVYPSALTRLLVLRPFWYAMLFLPLIAVAGVIGAVAGLPFGASGVVGRWAMAGIGSLLAIASVLGFVGTRRQVVRQLDVRLPRLPHVFDGLRVVQISDLHIGPHTSRRHLERVASAVLRARADMVVFTGDQVDDFARDVEHFVAARRRSHTERPHALRSACDSEMGMEHRFFVPAAVNGGASAGRLAPLHQPGRRLLGHSVPHRRPARGHRAHAETRREWEAAFDT